MKPSRKPWQWWQGHTGSEEQRSRPKKKHGPRAEDAEWLRHLRDSYARMPESDWFLEAHEDKDMT